MSDKTEPAPARMTPRPNTLPDAKHGALMDAVYRRQRYFYDATRKYFLLGRDRLIRDLRPEPGANVLEVGCGTGRNLVLAARRYPQARFHGFDISHNMLEIARSKIDRAGLADRITLAHGDASSFSAVELFGRRMDRVFLSYTISMIPPWREAIEQSVAALSETGSVYVVDFGQQERLPKIAKRLLDGWLRKFHVESRANLAAALESAAQAQGRRSEFQPLFRGYAWLGRIY